MNIIKRHLVLTNIILGAIFGYFVLHPFVMMGNAFFHMHEDDYLHLHWHDIFAAFLSSFESFHLPHAFTFVILSALIGYVYGKKINAYQTINDQLERFSVIGKNAAAIIHDLNNPLGGILGYADMLKSSGNDQKQVKYCENIIRAAKRISKMITDIKITAHGASEITLSKEPIELNPFIQSVISTMNLTNKVKVYSGYSGYVSFDQGYFERVLWNVFKNANEACNTEIRVTISESEGAIQICINNDGPLIPRNIQKKLFKIGQTYGKNGGTGIGLYNCKRIVEAHGGEIRLTSCPDSGTTIHIRIPKENICKKGV